MKVYPPQIDPNAPARLPPNPVPRQSALSGGLLQLERLSEGSESHDSLGVNPSVYLPGTSDQFSAQDVERNPLVGPRESRSVSGVTDSVPRLSTIYQDPSSKDIVMEWEQESHAHGLLKERFTIWHETPDTTPSTYATTPSTSGCLPAIEDSFNRANSPDLGPDWTENPTYKHLEIHNNHCGVYWEENRGQASYNTCLDSDSHFVQVEGWTGKANMTTDPEGKAVAFVLLYGRMAAVEDTDDCYWGGARDSSEELGWDRLMLAKIVGGVQTVLAIDDAVDVDPSGTWRFTIDGVDDATLKIERLGDIDLTTTDGDVDTGKYVRLFLRLQTADDATLTGGGTEINKFYGESI